MILHSEPSLKIYFGDAKDSCVKSADEYDPSCFRDILEKIKVEKLVLLKQIHSTKGFSIDSPSKLNSDLVLFEQEGDFIVTNQRKVGIGVITADCLPVIFYDPVFNTVAIAHVGWKGAFLGIVENTVKEMQEKFKAKPADLLVDFGPSAKVCCYEVSPNFVDGLNDQEIEEEVIIKKDDKIFFNLPRLVEIQLKRLGIKSENINKNYNSCTICDLRFHSHRRSGKSAGRQATIVALK